MSLCFSSFSLSLSLFNFPHSQFILLCCSDHESTLTHSVKKNPHSHVRLFQWQPGKLSLFSRRAGVKERDVTSKPMIHEASSALWKGLSELCPKTKSQHDSTELAVLKWKCNQTPDRVGSPLMKKMKLWACGSRDLLKPPSRSSSAVFYKLFAFSVH